MKHEPDFRDIDTHDWVHKQIPIEKCLKIRVDPYRFFVDILFPVKRIKREKEREVKQKEQKDDSFSKQTGKINIRPFRHWFKHYYGKINDK